MTTRKRLGITVILIFIFLLAAGLAAAWQGQALLGRPPLQPPQPAASQTSTGLDPQAYLPLTLGSQEAAAPWLNTQIKSEVSAFFLTEYQASEGVPHGWNGSHAACNAGNTSAAFKEAILRRINYFRAMAGVPPITAFKAEYNAKAQEAALMMSVNNALDHSPPSNWICYTADGAEGAGSSNLYLGVYGPAAITGYINDPGGGNFPVGHRRWVLYPQSQFLGTGDIPPTSYAPANALWVFDLENMWGPRPETREEYVAWPPPGYSPYQVVFPRWSFAYAGANFSNATVTMTRNGQPLSLQINPVVNGFGENTLVWEPNDTFGQAPPNDIVYGVTINNVIINGQSQNFSYQVTIFTP